MNKYIFLILPFVVYATCSGQNLTKETNIASEIKTNATPSAMVADCQAKNAGVNQGGGANLRNCDDLKKLYIDNFIFDKCSQIKNAEERSDCQKFFK